ncbi:hypothetical protein BH18ACI5_BH18ACI5_05420 [soil metagenome]
MRVRALALTILVLGSALTSAQGPSTAVAPPQTESSPAETMPVRRVVLYKTGVGYFEHLGTVRGKQAVTIRFTSAQLNDALKSLTAIDLDKGQVTGISYNSVAPLERRLGALRLPVNQQTTMMELLNSLRGARVEVSGMATRVVGRLLSVEQRSERRGAEVSPVQFFSVVTDAGEMRTFELSPAIRVRLAERDLRLEVGRYLDLLGSTREQDVRNMVISTAGSGERRLFVSYISEVPIWKSSYRLVFPASGKPLLQGWAIVDNTIGEDWKNVELSLVAGAPQSFIQDLSQPYYGQRPVVPLPSNVLLQPQTHGATLRQGSGTLSGVVRDQSGSGVPGVRIELTSMSGESMTAVSNPNGSYELNAPAGEYRLRAMLAGFPDVQMPSVLVPAGGSQSQDITLQVASLSESVRVAGNLAPLANRASAGGGRGGGVVGGVPEAPPSPAAPMPLDAYAQLRDAQAAASGATLGELFEYKIKEPVTLEKNKSALVPIVSAEITAERVSLWNRTNGSGRPLRAMWLTNSTGLTLDGGSIKIVDGNAFADEGLVEPLKPAEKRLVSYAADLGLLVTAASRAVPRRIVRVRARDGIIIQDAEERSTTAYDVRSEGTAATTLIVEHRLRPGWTLAPGQKPAESTPGAERFRMTVEGGKEAKLTVTEVSQGAAQIRVGEVTDALIAQLGASGVSAAELERALRPVIEQKSVVAAIDRRLRDLETERNRIVQDQERLRENMKALRGSAEEKQLLQRYTKQLDDQETRLATLLQDTDKANAERTEATNELARRISAVSFELVVG